MKKEKTTQKDSGKRKRRDLHSRAYRRYFQGHEEVGHLDEKGRTKIERIYHGDYYVRDLSETGLRKEKALCAVFCLFAVALFLLAAFRDLPANRTWFITVAHIAAFAMLLGTISGLFNYLLDGVKQTQGELRVGLYRLCKSSFAASIAMCICAILYFICMLIYEDRVQYLLCAVLCLAGGGMLFVVSRAQQRYPVKTEGKKTEQLK